MNQQERAIAHAKRLLKDAPTGPPCFERNQMEFIISRYEGTAGAPFPEGDEPDAFLIGRLLELNREVTRRTQPKEATVAA